MANGPVRVSSSWVSDRHLRVEFEVESPPDTGEGGEGRVIRWVAAACERLMGAGIEGVVDATPAAAGARGTVLVAVDLLAMGELLMEPVLLKWKVEELMLGGSVEAEAGDSRLVEIPVCYGPAHAPDLAGVAREVGVLVGEVAAMHAAAEYTVRFIGFAPGFPYLGGLPERLHVSRLESPRARVPPGSVAIAGDQCGIYPHATPGGWRLIGRTPLRLFDAGRAEPCLLGAGDRVRFVEITEREFVERLGAPGGLGEGSMGKEG